MASNKRRLNPDTVRKIREDYATGDITQTRLAARYHVHKNTVYKIVTGQIWAEAGGQLVHKRKDHLKKMLDNKKFKQAKLTEADVLDIRTAFSMGVTAASLADRYGITKFTISSIVNGKSWQHVGGPITSGKGRGGRKPVTGASNATTAGKKAPMAYAVSKKRTRSSQ